MNGTVSTLRNNSGTWRQTREGVNYETMWNPQALWIHIGLPVEGGSVFNLQNWRQLSLLCGILVSQIPSSSPCWLSPSSLSTTGSRLEMLTRTRSHPCLPLSYKEQSACNQITAGIALSNIIGVEDKISPFDSRTTACRPQVGIIIAYNHTYGQSSYQNPWFTPILNLNFS